MLDRARTAYNSLLDLLFPPRCVACRRLGAWLCPACRSRIDILRPPVCSRCGQRIAARYSLCAACWRQPLAIDGLRAAAYFSGPLRSAIHHFKYSGRRALAAPLGELLYDGYAVYQPPADVIVPVPLYGARERQRGFNQSLLLAQELGQRSGLPLAMGELARLRDTAQQMKLGRAERRQNVQAAFACTGNGLAGRRVLLVDDVCTTGATLEACAAALRQTGAASVWALALAREEWKTAPASP